MDNQYKVEFLSTVDIKGKLKVSMPTDEIDLKYRLESLLVERFKQGYKLFQIIDSVRKNPMNNKDMSGLLIVFEKMNAIADEAK